MVNKAIAVSHRQSRASCLADRLAKIDLYSSGVVSCTYTTVGDETVEAVDGIGRF